MMWTTPTIRYRNAPGFSTGAGWILGISAVFATGGPPAVSFWCALTGMSAVTGGGEIEDLDDD